MRIWQVESNFTRTYIGSSWLYSILLSEAADLSETANNIVKIFWKNSSEYDYAVKNIPNWFITEWNINSPRLHLRTLKTLYILHKNLMRLEMFRPAPVLTFTKYNSSDKVVTWFVSMWLNLIQYV
jgi:hypothetical protein